MVDHTPAIMHLPAKPGVRGDPMLIRPFEERDRPHCHRIWREVGWMKPGEEPGMDLLLDASRCLVVELNGESECPVMASPADIRPLNATLRLSAVAGATTSIV